MPMEDLLTRQAPHSQEAEQSVLGSMLIDSRCISDVVGVVRPEDFYMQANREIYETMYEMFSYSEVIDPVTVLDKMRARGVYNEESSTKYLMQLIEITPTAANVKRYAQIVHDKALLRNLSEAASGIVETVYEGVGSAQEILEAAEKRIYALRRGNTNESLEHIGTVLLKVFDRLKELSESGSDISGLSTGLRDLDKFINGLNRSDLVLLAARPGMGKTSMALNVALNVAKKNPQKTVAFFSLEMSKEQLVTRLISNESFVDNKKLVTGQLSMEEWSKIGIAATALSQTDIRVDDNPSLSVAEMNAKCRRLDNLCLVIIDYLQLMVSAGGRTYSGENRQQVVSDISRSLKIMAKELNVPVLCLSQLSRANESRQDKRPLLSDLRESGAIEQDADEVMFLYREDYYNKDTPEQNVAECIVAKNRHGETGTVKLQWLPQFTTFADREWRHDEGLGPFLVPPGGAVFHRRAGRVRRLRRGGFHGNALLPARAGGGAFRLCAGGALQPPPARGGVRRRRGLCARVLRGRGHRARLRRAGKACPQRGGGAGAALCLPRFHPV